MRMIMTPAEEFIAFLFMYVPGAALGLALRAITPLPPWVAGAVFGVGLVAGILLVTPVLARRRVRLTPEEEDTHPVMPRGSAAPRVLGRALAIMLFVGTFEVLIRHQPLAVAAASVADDYLLLGFVFAGGLLFGLSEEWDNRRTARRARDDAADLRQH